MKVEVNSAYQARCCAYVTMRGDLHIRSLTDSDAVKIDADGVVYNNVPFTDREATHKFYPGDSITITF